MPAIAFGLVLLFGASSGGAWAQSGQGNGNGAPAPGQTREPEWTRGSGTHIALFPAGNVFNVYVADPHRPTSAILEGFYTRTDIPDAESPRTGLAGGGSFGLLRIDSASGRSWQISLDAGLDAQFDSQNKLDAIGWDGNYGLTFETASRGPFAFRVGFFHVSSHLGDEYVIRQGLQELDSYTREEIAFGFAWRWAPAWRVYGETGVAWGPLNDLQEPWRVQTGLEWEGRPQLWDGRFAWYGATDLAAMQERGWRLDAALQGGIVTRSGGRAYRIYLDYMDGRPPLGMFFERHEARLTIGFKMDL